MEFDLPGGLLVQPAYLVRTGFDLGVRRSVAFLLVHKASDCPRYVR